MGLQALSGACTQGKASKHIVSRRNRNQDERVFSVLVNSSASSTNLKKNQENKENRLTLTLFNP